MTDNPEARIVEITQERDSWRRVAERLEGEKQAAEARVIALRQALEQYGRHPATCPKGVGIGYYKPRPDAVCNCGIDAALLADAAQERR